MMKIYGDTSSGNCYKVRLLATLAKHEYSWQHIDILAGESRSTEFLELNSAGAIPVLQLTDGTCLSESNAILFYLSENSALWPSDRLQQSKVLQWMFFEQYSHEPYIAVARFINKYLGLSKERLLEYQSKQVGGNKALAVMQQQLAKTDGFICSDVYPDSPTIADIALYAYTHVADEGGFSLQQYPAVVRWLDRIKALPEFRSMDGFEN